MGLHKHLLSRLDHVLPLNVLQFKHPQISSSVARDERPLISATHSLTMYSLQSNKSWADDTYELTAKLRTPFALVVARSASVPPLPSFSNPGTLAISLSPSIPDTRPRRCTSVALKSQKRTWPSRHAVATCTVWEELPLNGVISDNAHGCAGCMVCNTASVALIVNTAILFLCQNIERRNSQ